MRKVKIDKIKIDEKTEKEFTTRELTTAQLIELSQTNDLFGARKEEKEGEVSKKDSSLVPSFVSELTDFSGSAKKIMEMSCDYTLDDLKDLAPSEIEVLFKSFQEVNQTFLDLLGKTGILKVLKQIGETAISNFLKTVAI